MNRQKAAITGPKVHDAGSRYIHLRGIAAE